MERISNGRFGAAIFACLIGITGTIFAQVKNAVPSVARPLPLSAVRLTGGPLKHAQDLDAKYLLELQPDRMLAFYRERAGLQRKAEPYGGWDGDGRNLTGHIAGHYLSAVSMMWAATGDVRFKDRADYIVRELKVVQEKQGDGYLGAIAGGKEMFNEVAQGHIKSSGFDLNGQWSPWYTLHKMYAGLRDAYRFIGNKTALNLEIRFAAWAESVISRLDDDQVQRMLDTEFGGMNEILADLYADTGDKRWLVLSYRFEHRAALDPLKQTEDRLAGLHVNTLIPKLLGSAARYVYRGDAADGAAMRFFWNRVVDHHTFATGGQGKDEYFREADKLGRIIDGRTAESCNVYNMLKLTRLLFALQPDIRYAEFQERALFNHVLGSMDPTDGSTCYMVPVGRGVRREYADMFRSFTCCVGSGMENHALHGYGIYYESGDRFWVNLYTPSTADWTAAGIRVETETTFPEGESATIKLTVRSPKPFTLALRRPSWAGEGFTVKVNAAPVKELPKPGAYVELKRTWKGADTVTLTLPKALHLQPTPDNPRRAAIMWGPLVLSGDLGPEPPRGQGRGRGTVEEDSAALRLVRVDTPMLVAAERPVSEWLKPVASSPGSFHSDGVGRDRDVDFVPFYRLHRRVYAAYFDLFTPAEYERKAAENAVEQTRLRKLEAATVAFVQPGRTQMERDFNQQGENSSAIQLEGRYLGRRASNWFSFDLPVDASNEMVLVVTYHSDSRRPRAIGIRVDGGRIAEQRFDPSSESRLFDVEYPIPAELVRGKEKITVRFDAIDDSEVAVFGIRMIRR